MKKQFTFLLLCPALLFGQSNFNKAKMDSLFDVLQTNNKFLGSVTIQKNNEILYHKTLGVENSAQNEMANQELKYRIASISKMFTAVIIFQLIEENKLTLETKLSDFFPEIKNADKITMAHILNHRSGIYDLTYKKDYLTWSRAYRSQPEILEVISSGKPMFKPNKKYRYSNSNYVLLGYIIEKITKKEYALNLKERITDKIELKDTYYKGISSAPYKFIQGEWRKQPETDLSVPGGAGAVISTSNDLTKFITALFNHTLLNKNSLKEMSTIKEDNAGKGIFQSTFYTKNAYGHTGAIDDYRSRLFYFPEDSISIALCSNGDDYSNSKVFKQVVGIYYREPVELPKFDVFFVHTDTLKKYEGIYKHWLLPMRIKVVTYEKILMADPFFSDVPEVVESNFYPTSSTEFYSFKDGVSLTFVPNTEKVICLQNGQKLTFK